MHSPFTLDSAALGALAIAASLTFGRAAAAATEARSSGGAAAASDLPGLLERVRRATGAPLALARRDLLVTGRVEGSDTRSAFTWRFGDHGRFRRETQGVLGRTAGSDGDSTWLADTNGRSQVLELGDAENAKLLSLVLSGGWLAPASGVTIAAGPDSSDGLVRLDLGYLRRRARIAIDPASGEPRTLELRPSFGGETWTFAEFVEKDGVLYPRRIEQSLLVGISDRFVVESARLVPAAGTKDYAQPPGGAGTRFDKTIPADLRVERSSNGFLLVHPKIDGREVGAFIFDTGAGTNVITKQLADSLDLPKAGTSWLGMAAGAATAGVRTAQRVSLGPLTIERPVFLEMDLQAVSDASGTPIVGIIGYDVLMRATVEIEIATSRIAIHEPGRFEGDGVRWEPITIAGNHPHVNGSFGDVHGLFRLDTGAPQVPIIFNGPAVEKYKLLEGRETQKAKAGLPGGTMDIAFGPVEGLEIGGHRFGKMNAIFPLQRGGAFDDEYTIGNLGQECLQPFRAVFDYSQRRMALIDRPAPAADAKH
jgi:hypothetical protein